MAKAASRFQSIEACFGTLKCKIRERSITSKTALKYGVTQKWDAVTAEK